MEFVGGFLWGGGGFAAVAQFVEVGFLLLFCLREVVDQAVEHVGVADEAEEVVVGPVGFFGELVARLVGDHVGLSYRDFGLVDGLLWLGNGPAKSDGGRHGGVWVG